MTEKKFLHGKKFKPRPSQEDLIQQTALKFAQLGGENFVQATILHDLVRHIRKSRVGPEISRFLTIPKQRNGMAWLLAYAVVLEFLTQYEMQLTVSALSIENRGKPPKKDDSLLKGKTPVQFMRRLIPLGRKEVPFAEKVREFASVNGLAVRKGRRDEKVVIEEDFESDVEEVGTTLRFGDESD